MRGILFAVSLIVASTAGASDPWTNEAKYPSLSVARGMPTTLMLLEKLGVPNCAKSLLSQRLHQGGGQPLMVSNNFVFSPTQDYRPDMKMTFLRDGIDSVTEVHPNVTAPFVAEVYDYSCEGGSGSIAYMPKCGNLAELYPESDDTDRRHDNTQGKGHDNHNGNGYGHHKGHGTVPIPALPALLGIGFLAWILSRR